MHKSYEAAKTSLGIQLENFLFETSNNMRTCSPYDLCLFLAWCDRFGKKLLYTSEIAHKSGQGNPHAIALEG